MEEKKECYTITRQNYINMKKRLEKNLKFYNHILIVGTLYLIIVEITNIIFIDLFNQKWLSFISLVLSIVLFTISIIIRPEEVSKKIENLREGILKLNELIGEVENSIKNEDLEKIHKEKYRELMKKMINREDIDYYNTSIELLDLYSIKSEKYVKEMIIARKNNIHLILNKWLEYRYIITYLLIILSSLLLKR